MAVVLAYRAAIALGASAYRLVKIEQSATGQPGPTAIPQYLWERLQSSESDASLTQAVAEHSGRLSSVETISGTFELRKAQIRWGRDGGAAAGSDDAVTTHHFLYAPAGTPSSTWAEAQFLAVENALGAFWTSVKVYYTSRTVYKQVRWYKAGPQIGLAGAPVRVVDPNVSGSGAATLFQMPPQVAMSVTEKTADPKSWGRFYMPAPESTTSETYGRISAGLQTTLANAADTLYEACVSSSVMPVVFSTAKASRTSAGGTTLPASAARALPVHQLQVDDLFDVIRSRRWNTPLLRLQRDVAGS